MRKKTTVGAIAAMVFVIAAYAEKFPVRDFNGFGTLIFNRDGKRATLGDLRTAAAKAAAGGCREQIEIVALVDDSLSPPELARYGWRVVTRIGEVATLMGCAASAPYLGALPGIRYLKTPSHCHTTMDSARKETNVDQVHKTRPGWSGPRLTGKGVLFGIMDSDFDTRHKAFLDSNGFTRFVALWDQDTAGGFPNGRKRDHQGLLADSMFGLGTDGHGTFMASYGAGGDTSHPYYGVATEAMIAGVKTAYSEAQIIDGLGWLDSLATALRVPCVINMSLGSPEGPHDGTSLIDRAIDNVAAKAGHIVVGAAGNDGNIRGHVALQVGRNLSKGTLVTPRIYSPWIVSDIDLWGDSSKNIVATFNVFDTSSLTSRLITVVNTNTATANSWRVLWPNAINPTDTLYFTLIDVERASALNGKPHIIAEMYYRPAVNASLYLGVSVAVSGTTGGTVHAWNIRQTSFRSFSMTDYLDGDDNISVDELGGTAKRNITVGAYSSKNVYNLWNGTPSGWPPDAGSYHFLAGTSGRGPTVDGRIKPDITAPGHDVVGAMPRNIPLTSTSNLILWPDSPSTAARYAVAGGTSVASPIVAGIIALMLEIDPTLTVEKVRQILQETAINDTATGQIGTSYNNNWGAGKVNALGAVQRTYSVAAVKWRESVQKTMPYRLVALPGNRLRFVAQQGGRHDIAIEIFSINGRLVLKRPLERNNPVVSFNSLPQGTYYVRAVEKGRALCSMRIMVVK
jgi:minor extracellular serine protease Vpr